MKITNLLFLAVILFLASCEEPIQEPIPDPGKGSKTNPKSQNVINSLSVENGMLSLQQIEDFEKLLDELEYLEDNYESTYEENEEDYVIPEEALEEFEANLGFYSLRQYILLRPII